MTDWTGGPDPEHDRELEDEEPERWLLGAAAQEYPPDPEYDSELTDRPVESPAEFDNWAQDEAAADLEKLEPPPPGSEPA